MENSSVVGALLLSSLAPDIGVCIVYASYGASVCKV